MKPHNDDVTSKKASDVTLKCKQQLHKNTEKCTHISKKSEHFEVWFFYLYVILKGFVCFKAKLYLIAVYVSVIFVGLLDVASSRPFITSDECQILSYLFELKISVKSYDCFCLRLKTRPIKKLV